MRRGIGWVCWTSLGEGDRQQPRSILRLNAGDGIALEDVGVKVVPSTPRDVRLNSPGKAFRPKAAMHLPLVKVGALLPEQSGLSEHRQDILAAQCDVADLRP